MEEDLMYEEGPVPEPEPAEAEDTSAGLEDEERMEAEASMNTALPMSERTTALLNVVELCVKRHMKGDYSGKEKEEGGEDMLTSLLGGA